MSSLFPVTTVARMKSTEAHGPLDVFIGRPSKWGNPFVIGRDGTREEVISKFEEYVRRSPDLLADIGELQGKRLLCFCKPQACHGDVLVGLVSEWEESTAAAPSVPKEGTETARAHWDEIRGRLPPFPKEWSEGRTSLDLFIQLFEKLGREDREIFLDRMGVHRHK